MKVLETGKADGKENLRKEVEAQLATAKAKIAALQNMHDRLRNPRCTHALVLPLLLGILV